MTRNSRIIAVAAVFALMGVSSIGAAPDDLDVLAGASGVSWNETGSQTVPLQLSDAQIGELLTRTKKSADRFRRSFDRAVDRIRMDGSREDNNMRQFVKDFAGMTNYLSEHFDRHQVVRNEIEDVLRRSVSIDSFMQRHQLTVQAENDWLAVRRDLDDLARAYNVTWNWSNPRYTADERRTGLYHRLTGTYQLEHSRGDDPQKAAEQAARTLTPSRRAGAYERLMNRLDVPETIAIDRNQNTITMASSREQRVTLEADSNVRTEERNAGATVDTRATLHGGQLVVTTTGGGGNDVAVTFEPIDKGRSLRVTRRIHDDDFRQPVTVQSFYRKTSDEAHWDIYSTTGGTSSRPAR